MHAPYRFFRHTTFRFCAESALAPLHLLFDSQTLALVCSSSFGDLTALLSKLPSTSAKRFLVLLNYAGNLQIFAKLIVTHIFSDVPQLIQHFSTTLVVDPLLPCFLITCSLISFQGANARFAPVCLSLSRKASFFLSIEAWGKACFRSLSCQTFRSL